MKKKNNKMCVILVMVSLLFAGCGSSSSEKEMAMGAAAEEGIAYNSVSYADESKVVTEAVEEAEPAYENTSVNMEQTERKLIRNVELHVETDNFDVLMQTVTEKTQTLKGYVESSYVYNGSQYYENNRNANLTLRVPAENLDNFLSIMAESSNVTSQNENVEDVTLQYVDLESHKEALITEHDRLLELLEQAQTVEDIITIEGRLSEVRYQIESMESRLRTLSNQVSYSTVYLYIEEVQRYTPVNEQTTWEEISTGFVNNLYDVGEGIRAFCIGLIVNIPYLVIWGIVVTVIILIGKEIKKGKIIKKHKKAQKQKEAAQKEENEGK